MLEFLSPEWIAALDDAARSAAAPAGTDRDADPDHHLDLVLEQVVTADADADADADGVTTAAATVTYHVELDGGHARFRPGPAAEPDVRFTADRATAWAIASGHESAQRAFMAGRLQVGGDLRTLYEHQDALGLLSDAFASVREQTTAAEAPPGTTGTTGTTGT